MLFLTLALAGGLAADTSRWIVDNHGRVAGDLVVVTDGPTVSARWVFTDRNRGARVENRYRLGADGVPVSGESRPVLADGQLGEVGERFETTADSVIATVTASGSPVVTRWSRPAGAWAVVRGLATPWESAALARYLLTAPGMAAPVPGGGTIRAQVIADTTVTLGGRSERARLIAVRRPDTPAPESLWLDDRGGLIATGLEWFITVRPDAVSLLPAFRAIERRWRDAAAEQVAAKVRTTVSGPLVIANGDLFDSETGELKRRQTVVVEGERITAVGPADQVRAPAGATVIDAAGKTILPGFWEMHTHLGITNEGALSLIQLAQGVTTARDLAADLDVATSQRDRERQGKLASPRIILAGFIEGPLKWAGPSGSIARDEAEARAWVARYDSLGYRQIKLYNVVHPDLVPVIAAEAKRRGMRLSGHIPRGLSIRAAVSLGYDEIQHAAFLLSDFFPDSLFLPRMRAYSQVAAVVAPEFDPDSRGMKDLVKFLADHHTVIDGTFSIWVGGAPAWLGVPRPTSQTKSDAVYLRIIKRLYDAGVPLVAGTDNSSASSYHRELAVYAQAGIPVPKVLQIATIEAARVMGEAKDYGSIAAGKVADLILVGGNPAEKLADLEKIETVVRGGRVYRKADLEAAVKAAP